MDEQCNGVSLEYTQFAYREVAALVQRGDSSIKVCGYEITHGTRSPAFLMKQLSIEPDKLTMQTMLQAP